MTWELTYDVGMRNLVKPCGGGGRVKGTVFLLGIIRMIGYGEMSLQSKS